MSDYLKRLADAFEDVAATGYESPAAAELAAQQNAQEITIAVNDRVAVTLSGGCERTFEACVLEVRADGQLKVQPVQAGVKVGYLSWVWTCECVVLVKAEEKPR